MVKICEGGRAYHFVAMDSTDDAYYSDMTSDMTSDIMSEFSVVLGPVVNHGNKTSQNMQRGEEARESGNNIDLVLPQSDKENCSPDSDDTQNEHIFSFMRHANGKIALNKGTSLPSRWKAIDDDGCQCHCGACCSCHSDETEQAHCHNCRPFSKKMSDSRDSPNSNLPSPTAIESWGHFGKHRRSHYKYRRSDYSSDSDEEGICGAKKKLSSQASLLAKQKSHLPSLTLMRQSSSASNYSFDKSATGSVDLSTKEGVKPVDFKERAKVQYYFCL